MKQFANKALPLACAIATPFFVSADDQADSALFAAANKPAFAGAKIATGPHGVSSNAGTATSQITPPAGPTIESGADVFVTADFIYWKAGLTNFSYAQTGGLGANATAPVSKGSEEYMHVGYRPGFKVGLGILSAHDHWDLFAEYTWFNLPKDHAHGKTTSSSTGDTGTNNIKSPTLPAAGTLTEIGRNYSLNLNVLDVELGRDFWISKRLSLRPHLGMKFSWLDHHVTDYGKGSIPGSPPTPTESHYKADLDQFGVGIRTGLDSAYYICDKWSLFGDLAITGMWNDFDSRIVTSTKSGTADPVVELNSTSRPESVSGIIELDLGVRFETIFGKGKYMYLLQAGWETQTWMKQGAFQDGSDRDLFVQGLTVKTGFWF